MQPRSSLFAALATFCLAATPARGQDEFVQVRDGGFVLGGEPFAAVGANCYYLMVYGAEASLRRHIDEVIDEAAALGATVLRTWAFNDGAEQWNALQTAPGVYDERIFRGLDYAVLRAGQRGLRLLLPLVNNWADYGGMDQYVAWSPSAAAHDDFYTDPECRRMYKDHVRAVLTRASSLNGRRYMDDPAIFAWELGNEPRAPQKGPAVLDAWIAEMAAYVKSIDSRHLLTSGSEGFYGPADAARNSQSWMAREGVDFIANHAHAEIDFASFHAWPDSWGQSRAQAMKWLADHFADGRARLGKPVLLGEYGKKQPVATRDDYFRGFHAAALAATEPGAARAGLLVWILYHDAYQDYDGFGVYQPAAAHQSTVALLRERHAELAQRLAPPPARFRRGDARCDGGATFADAVSSLRALFVLEPRRCCLDALDANDDGAWDIGDPLFLLFSIFPGSVSIPPPHGACGTDPTADGLADACAPLETACD